MVIRHRTSPLVRHKPTCKHTILACVGAKACSAVACASAAMSCGCEWSSWRSTTAVSMLATHAFSLSSGIRPRVRTIRRFRRQPQPCCDISCIILHHAKCALRPHAVRWTGGRAVGLSTLEECQLHTYQTLFRSRRTSYQCLPYPWMVSAWSSCLPRSIQWLKLRHSQSRDRLYLV